MSRPEVREEQRILVWTPSGRDALLAAELLARAGFVAEPCDDGDVLCAGMTAGCAAVLVAEEALRGSALDALAATVATQPTWSDLPILVFTSSGRDDPRIGARLELLRQKLGNVTFLERPMRAVTLVTALHGALRARRRQYELRALLARRENEVRERDTFLAMLGHELRNPLASILMASDLMERSGQTAFERPRGIVRRQGKHLARLVDDLLDVSRVTTGKITLQRRVLDLAEVVRRGIMAAEGAISAQRLEVSHVSDGRPVMIDGDEVRVEQVFTNLLTNAVKYTPPGGSVVVRLARDGGEAVLSVEDTGIGIPPEQLPGVFDLFTQVHTSIDRSRGGLGIGLTVVRRLVELHGGRVSVSSRGTGQGTVFTVRLPLAEEARSSALRAEGAPGGPRRVVVVEDQTDFRELLVAALEEDGHVVQSAEDGLQGARLIAAARPEVAIVDIGLPGMDGYAVARESRAALGTQVLLVALTGYGQPQDRERARDAGFDVHLTKPLDMQALQSVLAGRTLAKHG